MKNRKKIFILTEAILAVLVVMLAYAMIREKSGQPLDKVSVIVQNSDDNQWSGLKYGLKKAAEDQGVEIFVVSEGPILTAEAQKELIDREINEGADAVLDVEKSKLPVVEADNYAMGAALAGELLDDYNGNIRGKTLGIVSETDRSEAAVNRSQGFQDTLEDAGAKFSWMLTIPSDGNGESLLAAQTKVDFVIALDDTSLTTVGKCSSENNLHGSLVYGIGSSSDGFYYLETNAVECLVVPDGFMAGYKSMTEIVKCLRSYVYKPQSQTVSHTILRRDQLFSKENQELLYIMSQST